METLIPRFTCRLCTCFHLSPASPMSPVRTRSIRLRPLRRHMTMLCKWSGRGFSHLWPGDLVPVVLQTNRFRLQVTGTISREDRKPTGCSSPIIMLSAISLASVEWPTSSKLSVASPPACSRSTSSPPGCWCQTQTLTLPTMQRAASCSLWMIDRCGRSSLTLQHKENETWLQTCSCHTWRPSSK